MVKKKAAEVYLKGEGRVVTKVNRESILGLFCFLHFEIKYLSCVLLFYYPNISLIKSTVVNLKIGCVFN